MLKPCPFCRSYSVVVISTGYGSFVRCNGCECRGPKVRFDDSQRAASHAAHRWNKLPRKGEATT